MVAKYSVLKFVAVADTIFSIYNAFTERILLEDIVIIILIAGAIMAIASETDKTGSHQRHEKKANAEEELKKQLDEIEGIVRKKINETALSG